MYKKRNARKGISPVIASIVLIGVTIAVSVALGGWIFGLFGGYSQASAVKVITANATFTSLGSENPSITVKFANTGGSSDSVTQISISAGGNSGVGLAASPTINANDPGSNMNFGAMTWTPGIPTFAAGQTLSITIVLGSGISMTQVVVLS